MPQRDLLAHPIEEISIQAISSKPLRFSLAHSITESLVEINDVEREAIAVGLYTLSTKDRSIHTVAVRRTMSQNKGVI
ncbi:MAG: hypothetical protein ACRCZZ_05645 [Phocaeicola sp.]